MLVVLLVIPCPEGLTPKAWQLVAILLTTIAAMALMAIVIVSLTQVT